MNSSSFFAKILLFGEYGIIKNSKGISIPFNNYSGSLKIDKSSNENIKLSNNQIKSFYDFLKLKFDNDEFNFKTFKSDIDDGNISPKIPGYVFLKSVDDDFNLFISIEIPFISLVSKSNFTNPSKEDDELVISRSLREMLF